MRRFLGSITSLSVGILMAATAASSAGAASVSPSTFTKDVCATIATAAQLGKTTLSTFKAAVGSYKASPSPATAAAVRDAYTQAYLSLDQEAGAVVAAIDQTGTPSGGTSFVKALKNALQTQQVAAQQFAQQTAAIDTSSASAFATSFQQALDAAKAEGTKMRKSLKANASITNAARAYHPLVTFLTTDADTCSKS